MKSIAKFMKLKIPYLSLSLALSIPFYKIIRHMGYNKQHTCRGLQSTYTMISYSVQFYILSAVVMFSSSVVSQEWSEIESGNLSTNFTDLQNATNINGICDEDMGLCVCSGNCPLFVEEKWSLFGSGCICAQPDGNTDCQDMDKCDCIYDCHCTSSNATGSTGSVQGGGSNYHFIDGIKFYTPLVACPDGGALPLLEYVKPIENSSDANANIGSEDAMVSGSGTISSLGRYTRLLQLLLAWILLSTDSFS